MRDLQSASSGFLCTKKFSFSTGMQQGWEGARQEGGWGWGDGTLTDGSKGT